MNKCQVPIIQPTSYLSLLRGYATMHGVCVSVKGKTATVCSEEEYGCGDRDKALSVARVRITPSGLDLLLHGLENKADSISMSTETSKDIDTTNLMEEAEVCTLCDSLELIMEYKGRRSVRRMDVVVWILRQMAISELDLSGCRLSKGDIVLVCKLPELKMLSLNNCCLQPNTLPPVQALERLEELYVEHNTLSSKDFGAILSCTKLKKLNVHK